LSLLNVIAANKGCVSMFSQTMP